jgi:hypothetical protein
VEGEPKQRGTSFQRAPVRNTQRMPSKQLRETALGRPPAGDGCGARNKSSTKDQCSSVSCGSGSVLDPAGAKAPSTRDRVISDLHFWSLLRRTP